MNEKIKLGISACLLGKKVRYDGGHKADHFLTDALGQYFQYVPVCPEVEMGLPVPREAMRLVKSTGDETPHLVTQNTGIDYTRQMLSWTQSCLDQLEKENLCGYILKSKSPSCGMDHIEVFNGKSVIQKNGIGVFTKALMERFPGLPVENEGRLRDMGLRENFIARVFTYHRKRSATAAL